MNITPTVWSRASSRRWTASWDAASRCGRPKTMRSSTTTTTASSSVRCGEPVRCGWRWRRRRSRSRRPSSRRRSIWQPRPDCPAFRRRTSSVNHRYDQIQTIDTYRYSIVSRVFSAENCPFQGVWFLWFYFGFIGSCLAFIDQRISDCTVWLTIKPWKGHSG